MKINISNTIKYSSLILAAVFMAGCSKLDSADATFIVQKSSVASRAKYMYKIYDKNGYSFTLFSDEKFSVGDKLKLVKQ